MWRWTLRVLCWLALGAVAQALVAIKIYTYEIGFARSPVMVKAPPGMKWSAPALFVTDGVATSSPYMPDVESARRVSALPAPTSTGFVSSALKDLRVSAAPGLSGYMEMRQFRYGWPARCVCWNMATVGQGHVYTHDAIDIMPLPVPIARLTHIPMIPRDVIGSGFALNTFFYALPIALLWLAPGTIRRWHRRRHSHCPVCNYNLTGLATGSACPECGKASTITSPVPEKF